MAAVEWKLEMFYSKNIFLKLFYIENVKKMI